MNLNQLRFARAVVDAGTFTAAADRCFVTQSTLSTGIALLERELGAKLFVRTTRSVSLTPFGRRLLPLIDKLLSAQAELLDTAEELLHVEATIVRLGVCPLVDSKRLEQILAPYRRANRNVRVVLKQLGGVDPKTALEQAKFDFVIGPSETRRRQLERSLLYVDQLVYVPAADGLTVPSGDGPVRLQDIAGDTFLLLDDSCGLTALTRQLFRTRRLALHEYEGRSVTFPVLEEWSAVGLGSAILPRSKLSAPERGRPIVMSNGNPALIRFDAVWSLSADRAPHVEALARHLKAGGSRLGTAPV